MKLQWALGLALCLALLALANTATAQSTGSSDPLAGILRQGGLSAVSPPTHAVDVTLPDLTGHDIALSMSRGRWVLLTFFATWCGPCAMELPTLERLHQARSGQGLEVLGIAVDGTKDEIKAFVQGKGLSFRVLLDTKQQASRIYRASSLPTSYLIDPDGRIVAAARGARDWSRATAMIDQLLALMPPSGASGPGAAPVDPTKPSYKQSQDPVELPSNLVPPDATVSVLTTSPVAGEPLALNVRVKWAGSFEDYRLLPPQVQLPEGVTLQKTAASTSSEDGRAVVNYKIELLAPKPGRYAFDPVEVRYVPLQEAAEPVSRRITGPTVDVGEPTLGGLPPLVWLVVLLVVLAAAGSAVLWWTLQQRREARAVAAKAKHADFAQVSAALEAARRARMHGDAAACLTAIQTIDLALGGALGQATAADAEFTALLDKVRYGGFVPPPHELDHMLRRAERLVAEAAPAEASAKESIKLKTETRQS